MFRPIGYAIAASVLIAVAIATVWRVNPGAPEAKFFETATSASNASMMHYVFELGFAPNTTDNARQQVFAALNSVDVSRSSGDHYKVTVPLTVDSVEELQAFAEKIRSMPHVMSANVIALQLPILSDE